MVRSVLKANVPLIAEATKGKAAGQLALLKAIQSWVLSPQGVNALVSAAKIIEVLYDSDQVSEGDGGGIGDGDWEGG